MSDRNRARSTTGIMNRMLVHYLMGLAGLFLCKTVDANVTDCTVRNLAATVDDTMRLYIDGIEITGLPNANTWVLSDTVVLPCTARIIGIEGTNVAAGGGILSVSAGYLASTDDGYIITNASWKCTKDFFTDWQTPDFDDSDWPMAIEVAAHRASPHQAVPGIRDDAFWIWTTEYNEEHLVVYCRKTLGQPVTPPMVNGFVWKANPSYGPISGGTKVNIRIVGWSQTNLNITAVYFGSDLKTSIIHRERLNDSLVVLTPSTNEFLIGVPLMIRVKFSPGLFTVNTSQTFTYEGNPNITDITPKTFLITGGTLLTVTGSSLNFAANPFMKATVNVHRETESNSTSTTNYEPCNSSAGNGSQMVCVVPPVNLPLDFLAALDNRSSIVGQTIVGSNGKDTADISIGFILDGYRKYENITQAIPDLQLEIFPSPEILSGELIRFNSKNDVTITIKGRHMTRGCRLEDYKVHIGSGICSIKLLTDNLLTCTPPTSEPQRTDNDAVLCDRNLAVIVTIGYKTYHCACLTYVTSFNEIALAAGLGVGLGLLFLAIVITAAVLIYRRKIAKNS